MEGLSLFFVLLQVSAVVLQQHYRAPPKSPEKFLSKERENAKRLMQRPFNSLFDEHNNPVHYIAPAEPVSPHSSLIHEWDISSMRLDMSNNKEWSEFVPKLREYVHKFKDDPEYKKYLLTDPHLQRGPERFTKGSYQERVYFHQFGTENIVMDTSDIPRKYFKMLKSTLKQSFSSVFPPGALLEEDIEIDIYVSFVLLRQAGGHHAYHYHGPHGMVNWVAVLYLDVPQEQEELNRLWVSDYKTSSSENTEVNIHAKQGDLLIHPSWMSHGTEETKWKSLRSLIAVNFLVNISKPIQAKPKREVFSPQIGMEHFRFLGTYLYHKRAPTALRKSHDIIGNWALENHSPTRELTPLKHPEIKEIVTDVISEYLEESVADYLAARQNTHRRESRGICPDMSSVIGDTVNVESYRTLGYWQKGRYHSFQLPEIPFASPESINTTKDDPRHVVAFFLSSACEDNAIRFFVDDPTYDYSFKQPTYLEDALFNLEMKKITASSGDVVIIPSHLIYHRMKFTAPKMSKCQVCAFYASYEYPYVSSCSNL